MGNRNAPISNLGKHMVHAMDSYIFDRLLIDASRVIALGKQQSRLEHPGLQGRFREILIDGILEPWLPPTVRCATGTVISFRNHHRSKTQEDILLIDQSISPSVLIKPYTQEGVYMRNSVLARIEVKSNLEKKHVVGFKKSCQEYNQLKLDLDDERYNANRINIMELNFLFAFGSKRSSKTVLSWFKETIDGSISAVCILNHGFWKLNENRKWSEYLCCNQNPNDKSLAAAEHLAAFVGLISNTSFDQHIKSQGRDRLASIESGIGQYFTNNWKQLS
jgi:hypothetical protein